jgi:hypothetical protein
MVSAPVIAPPDDDDDEDDIRTIMRPSLDEQIRLQIAAASGPGNRQQLPGIQPPQPFPSPPDEDDDDDIRTVMRDAPPELRAALAGVPVPGAARLGGGGVDPLAMTAPGLASPPGFPMAPQQAPGSQAPYQGFPPPQHQPPPGSYPGAFGQGGMHGPYGGTQPMSQQPYQPSMPPMPYAPPQRSSGAGLAVLVAILALLVAAGATFLYLRIRAGASPFG